MKKFLLGSLVLCLGFVLTGCGNDKNESSSGGVSNTKTLVCNQKVTTVDVELDTHYTNDVISGMDMKYVMDLSQYNDEQIKAIGAQDFCTIVKNAMTGFEKAFGNCKQNISNKSLLITADLDIDKITGMDVGKNQSIEQVKKELESVNYSCIIR